MSNLENISTNCDSNLIFDKKSKYQKKVSCSKKLLFKLYIIFSIPVLFLLCLYFIWLFASKVDITFKHGNSEPVADTNARVWAQNKINNFLTNGYVSGHKDLSEGLMIEVVGNEWKSMSRIKRKSFIRNIARARKILGVPNNITVIDNISQTVYATYSTSEGLSLAE